MESTKALTDNDIRSIVFPLNNYSQRVRQYEIGIERIPTHMASSADKIDRNAKMKMGMPRFKRRTVYAHSFGLALRAAEYIDFNP